MTDGVPRRTRWAGKAKGTHVPGAPLQGLRSARARGLPRGLHGAAEGWRPRSGLRAPGSGVRLFVPAHARPILTDGVRGSPATNRRARLACSAPSDPRSSAPPTAHVVWACSARLLLSAQYPGRLPLQLRVRAAGLSLRPWSLALASALIVPGPSGAQDAQAVLPSLPARPSPW